MPCAAVVCMPHFCPQVTLLFLPHIGGIITKGAPTVKISGLPAVRLGDSAMCMGFLGLFSHPAPIIKGSSTVMICGQPAAFMTSNTATGGMILAGIPNVQIGM